MSEFVLSPFNTHLSRSDGVTDALSTTMTGRLSSEVGVAEPGGRHTDGAAQAQRAADLIATLGAQNKAQREQIAALKAAITALQLEFKAAEQVHEAAKVSKNAELLDFMKAHAREQQTKQTVAQLRQANAAKWQQVKEEQAKLAELGSQSAKHAQEEAQAAERRRAHAATVEAVRQRAELPEAVLGDLSGVNKLAKSSGSWLALRRLSVVPEHACWPELRAA